MLRKTIITMYVAKRYLQPTKVAVRKLELTLFEMVIKVRYFVAASDTDAQGDFVLKVTTTRLGYLWYFHTFKDRPKIVIWDL